MKYFELAYKKLQHAQRQVNKAVETDFPIGSVVFYAHGEQERFGRVMSHAGDRLRIITRTKKTIWINATRVKRVLL